MWMTFIRCWYASTNIPFFPFNLPFCSVRSNKLGPDGGKAFAKVLETNTSLKSLK